MKPYYGPHAGITIYHGDCREIIPQLPKTWCRACDCGLSDEDVLAIHMAAGHAVIPYCDLCLSDPPYGINYVHGGNDDDKNPPKFAGEAVVGDDAPFEPSHLLHFEKVILWGANHYADKLPVSRGWLVWDKRCNTVVNDQSDCEMAWSNVSTTARIYYHVWDGFRRQTEKDVPRVHPTQKPVALMEWCINRAGFSHQLIDPYMGSGTTLVAAKNRCLPAIGIEIEEKYCEIAAKRLSQEVFEFK